MIFAELFAGAAGFTSAVEDICKGMVTCKRPKDIWEEGQCPWNLALPATLAEGADLLNRPSRSRNSAPLSRYMSMASRRPSANLSFTPPL